MDGRPHRIVAVGEVLFDCFPDGERLGGAPLNFAYHLHRLGQPVALCSRVGDDERGRRIRAALEQAGMATEGLQVDPDHPTGWVSVALDGAGGHSFTIHCDVAYDHLEAAAVARLAGAPGVALYYFGTLACRTPRGRAAVLGGAAACRGRRLLDVNLRPGCWDRGQVVACLEAATVAKLNHEEVATLAPLLGLPEAEGAAAEGLRRRFDLEAVVVTRGAAGAAWYHG
ncbi:MAG: carbohydrate kinase, partial [Nitrospirae bacterium]